MKKSIKIAQITRRRISLFLLLNFLAYNLFLAFPHKECDGGCDTVISNEHECCSSTSEMQNDCCTNMPELVQITNFSKELNIDENSCEYKLDINENEYFIISQKVNLTTISLSVTPAEIITDIQKPNSFRSHSESIFYSGPPIYLRIANLII